MDIRDEFNLDELKALSKSEEGKDILVMLTRNERAGLIMLKDEKLLSTVVKYDGHNMFLSIAHCLVLGGNETVKIKLSQMPGRILGLVSSDNDRVVDFLIGSGSARVNETLAGNPQALGIICGETLNESGKMELYGRSVKVMNAKYAKRMRGNCVAHVLLGAWPPKEVVEIISEVASKEVLEHKNGQGISVKEAIEKAMSRFEQKSKMADNYYMRKTLQKDKI